MATHMCECGLALVRSEGVLNSELQKLYVARFHHHVQTRFAL